MPEIANLEQPDTLSPNLNLEVWVVLVQFTVYNPVLANLHFRSSGSNTMKQSARLFFVLLISSLVLSFCSPASSSQETKIPEPVKLKVLSLPYISYAPFFIAQEDGYFAAQGLEVEFIRMDKTTDAIPALVQGQLDVASGLMEVNMLNAVAQNGNIRYVADKGFLDPNSCPNTTWVARKELVDSGRLDDLHNLKDMKVAFSPVSSAEYALDTLLQDSGLSSEDVQILDIPVPARLEGLGTGAVDIAAMSEPWATRAINAGSSVIWQPWEKYMPNFELSIIMYGPNLLEKNPDIGKRFMVAYLNALEQYAEGKTDRNVEIVVKYTELKPEEVRQSCWIAVNPKGTINVPQILEFQDWAINKGYLVDRVTPEQFLDTSFLEQALQLIEK